jgi:hypothetical protein
VQLTLTLARAVTHFSHLIVCLGRRRIDGTATKHVFNAFCQQQPGAKAAAREKCGKNFTF